MGEIEPEGRLSASADRAKPILSVRRSVRSHGLPAVGLKTAIDVLEIDAERDEGRNGVSFQGQPHRLHKLFRKYPPWICTPQNENHHTRAIVRREIFDEFNRSGAYCHHAHSSV